MESDSETAFQEELAVAFKHKGVLPVKVGSASAGTKDTLNPRPRGNCKTITHVQFLTLALITWRV